MYPPKVKCHIQTITEHPALSLGSRYIMVNNDLRSFPFPQLPSKLISYYYSPPSLHASSTGFLERIKYRLT